MFTLGIPNRQYRRTTQVLRSEMANPIEYEAVDQKDGFYLFSFPDIDEFDFREAVLLLKQNGVTTIGADEQLSERKIMKLTNLLKEEEQQNNRMETAEDVIVMVDEIITDNPDTALDLLSDIVEDFYENQSIDRPDTDLSEKKLRKLIQNIIKEWRK